MKRKDYALAVKVGSYLQDQCDDLETQIRVATFLAMALIFRKNKGRP